MRINSRLRTEIAFDGAEAGEGLAIFLSQNGDATARYRFLVKAILSQGVYQVGEFYSSPPLATALPGRLSRMVAGAVCPGATSWTVEISAIPDEDGETPTETADVILASSRCYAQVGVERVGERYAYQAGTGTQNVPILAGMKVTGIAAFGLGGGGSIVLGTGGNSITIPAGVAVNLAPEVSLAPNTLIALTNVDWVIEYLESA